MPITGNDTKTNLDVNVSFYRVPGAQSGGGPRTGGPCTVTKLRPNVSLSSHWPAMVPIRVEGTSISFLTDQGPVGEKRFCRSLFCSAGSSVPREWGLLGLSKVHCIRVQCGSMHWEGEASGRPFSPRPFERSPASLPISVYPYRVTSGGGVLCPDM